MIYVTVLCIIILDTRNTLFTNDAKNISIPITQILNVSFPCYIKKLLANCYPCFNRLGYLNNWSLISNTICGSCETFRMCSLTRGSMWVGEELRVGSSIILKVLNDKCMWHLIVSITHPHVIGPQYKMMLWQ